MIYHNLLLDTYFNIKIKHIIYVFLNKTTKKGSMPKFENNIGPKNSIPNNKYNNKKITLVW